MSVLSYLENRASGAILSSVEESSIATSISALKNRLTIFFGDKLTDQFRFGSSTRGTILPRRMDEHSDIDYMVVFSETNLAARTYLDRLKKFAEVYYSTSDIKQSTPTVVLQLNHIKFDLVPAIKCFGGYKIIGQDGNWLETNPNDFNSTLTAANNANQSRIKPTIRLAKFWNAQNGYVFDSFGFEKWIAGLSYLLCTNQKDFLFKVFENLSINQGAQWRNEKVERAKKIIADVRTYESSGYLYSAETEIKKLIPDA